MRLTLVAAAIALLAGCGESPRRPAPIARTEPTGTPPTEQNHLESWLSSVSRLESTSYAGPAPVLPWVPLEPTPGFNNPAPEPFPGFNGRGLEVTATQGR